MILANQIFSDPFLLFLDYFNLHYHLIIVIVNQHFDGQTSLDDFGVFLKQYIKNIIIDFSSHDNNIHQFFNLYEFSNIMNYN